uniref:Uncharacterized protein n=1 Tax=viral metagenome TaxID=1070528 RepID=A0A6H2A0G5_9ZZZZ
MDVDYKPRFSFEITEEQRLRASNLLATYGLRKAIFGKILDDVLDIIEEHGGMAIGILMSEKVKTKDVIPSMREVETYKKVKPRTKKGA